MVERICFLNLNQRSDMIRDAAGNYEALTHRRNSTENKQELKQEYMFFEEDRRGNAKS